MNTEDLSKDADGRLSLEALYRNLIGLEEFELLASKKSTGESGQATLGAAIWLGVAAFFVGTIFILFGNYLREPSLWSTIQSWLAAIGKISLALPMLGLTWNLSSSWKLRRLKSQDPLVRKKVVESLAVSGNPKIIRYLISYLNQECSEDGNERDKLKDEHRTTVGKGILRNFVITMFLLVVLLGGYFTPGQGTAYCAEPAGIYDEEIDETRLTQELERIIILSKSKSPIVRSMATDNMRRFANPKTAEALIGPLKALSQDEDLSTRFYAAEMFGQLAPDIRARDILINMLGDKEPQVVAAAADSLGSFSDSVALEALVALSGHNDPLILVKVAGSLGNSSDPSALETLIRLSASDYPYVRKAVALSLGKIHSSESAQALKILLADEFNDVRSAAVSSLAKLGYPGTVKELIGKLSDKDDYVQFVAARELVNFQDKVSVQELVNGHRQQRRWDVRDTLERTLLGILDNTDDPAILEEISRSSDRKLKDLALTKLGRNKPNSWLRVLPFLGILIFLTPFLAKLKSTALKSNKLLKNKVYLAAGIVILIDQLSQVIVRSSLPFYSYSVTQQPNSYIYWLQIAHDFNPFSNIFTALLLRSLCLFLTIIAISILSRIIYKYKPSFKKIQNIALGMIIGAALSIILDGIFLSGSTDWIRVCTVDGVFEMSMSIADICLYLGLLIVVIQVIWIAIGDLFKIENKKTDKIGGESGQATVGAAIGLGILAALGWLGYTHWQEIQSWFVSISGRLPELGLLVVASILPAKPTGHESPKFYLMRIIVFSRSLTDTAHKKKDWLDYATRIIESLEFLNKTTYPCEELLAKVQKSYDIITVAQKSSPIKQDLFNQLIKRLSSLEEDISREIEKDSAGAVKVDEGEEEGQDEDEEPPSGFVAEEDGYKKITIGMIIVGLGAGFILNPLATAMILTAVAAIALIASYLKARSPPQQKEIWPSRKDVWVSFFLRGPLLMIAHFFDLDIGVVLHFILLEFKLTGELLFINIEIILHKLKIFHVRNKYFEKVTLRYEMERLLDDLGIETKEIRDSIKVSLGSVSKEEVYRLSQASNICAVGALKDAIRDTNPYKQILAFYYLARVAEKATDDCRADLINLATEFSQEEELISNHLFRRFLLNMVYALNPKPETAEKIMASLGDYDHDVHIVLIKAAEVYLKYGDFNAVARIIKRLSSRKLPARIKKLYDKLVIKLLLSINPRNILESKDRHLIDIIIEVGLRGDKYHLSISSELELRMLLTQTENLYVIKRILELFEEAQSYEKKKFRQILEVYAFTEKPAQLCDAEYTLIADKAKELTAECASDGEKLAAILTWLSDKANIEYSIGYGGYWDASASLTYIRRQGMCFNLSNLLIALARAAGITAEYGVIKMKREAFEGSISKPRYEKIEESTEHIIARFLIGGKWLIFDHRYGYSLQQEFRFGQYDIPESLYYSSNIDELARRKAKKDTHNERDKLEDERRAAKIEARRNGHYLLDLGTFLSAFFFTPKACAIAICALFGVWVTYRIASYLIRIVYPFVREHRKADSKKWIIALFIKKLKIDFIKRIDYIRAWFKGEAAEFKRIKRDTKLGEHTITGAIGSGGYAIVWRAVKDDGSEWAIKVVPTGGNKAVFKSVKAMLLAELEIAKKIGQHPNIVELYRYDEFFGSFYVVMEFVKSYFGEKVSPDINSLIYREHRGVRVLSLRQKINVFRQAACGQRHIHSKGVIHGDIKPENILVPPDGEAKIADFGFSNPKILELKAGRDLLLGSVLYMSLEQISKGMPVDYRTDIYSLGVSMFEFFTGTPPYEVDLNSIKFADKFRIRQIMTEKIKKGPFMMPHKLNPEIPAALERIILKCMAPEPKDRYSCADELIADLDKLTGTPSETKPRVSPKIHSGYLHILFYVGLILAAILVLGTVLKLFGKCPFLGDTSSLWRKPSLTCFTLFGLPLVCAMASGRGRLRKGEFKVYLSDEEFKAGALLVKGSQLIKNRDYKEALEVYRKIFKSAKNCEHIAEIAKRQIAVCKDLINANSEEESMEEDTEESLIDIPILQIPKEESPLTPEQEKKKIRNRIAEVDEFIRRWKALGEKKKNDLQILRLFHLESSLARCYIEDAMELSGRTEEESEQQYEACQDCNSVEKKIDDSDKSLQAQLCRVCQIDTEIGRKIDSVKNRFSMRTRRILQIRRSKGQKPLSLWPSQIRQPVTAPQPVSIPPPPVIPEPVAIPQPAGIPQYSFKEENVHFEDYDQKGTVTYSIRVGKTDQEYICSKVPSGFKGANKHVPGAFAYALVWKTPSAFIISTIQSDVYPRIREDRELRVRYQSWEEEFLKYLETEAGRCGYSIVKITPLEFITERWPGINSDLAKIVYKIVPEGMGYVYTPFANFQLSTLERTQIYGFLEKEIGRRVPAPTPVAVVATPVTTIMPKLTASASELEGEDIEWLEIIKVELAKFEKEMSSMATGQIGSRAEDIRSYVNEIQNSEVKRGLLRELDALFGRRQEKLIPKGPRASMLVELSLLPVTFAVFFLIGLAIGNSEHHILGTVLAYFDSRGGLNLLLAGVPFFCCAMVGIGVKKRVEARDIKILRFAYKDIPFKILREISIVFPQRLATYLIAIDLDTGKPIGYSGAEKIILYSGGVLIPVLKLFNLWVNPQYRCSGIGMRLHLEAIKLARESSIDNLFFDVRSNNKTALSIYNSAALTLGAKIKIEESRPGIYSILMTLPHSKAVSCLSDSRKDISSILKQEGIVGAEEICFADLDTGSGMFPEQFTASLKPLARNIKAIAVERDAQYVIAPGIILADVSGYRDVGLRDSSFDIVTINNPRQLQTRDFVLICEAKRILKPDGLLLMTFAISDEEHENEGERASDKAKAALKFNGFIWEELEYIPEGYPLSGSFPSAAKFIIARKTGTTYKSEIYLPEENNVASVRVGMVVAGVVVFVLLCWLGFVHAAPSAMVAGMPFACCMVGVVVAEQRIKKLLIRDGLLPLDQENNPDTADIAILNEVTSKLKEARYPSYLIRKMAVVSSTQYFRLIQRLGLNKFREGKNTYLARKDAIYFVARMRLKDKYTISWPEAQKLLKVKTSYGVKWLHRRIPDLFIIIDGVKYLSRRAISAEVQRRDLSHLIPSGFISMHQAWRQLNRRFPWLNYWAVVKMVRRIPEDKRFKVRINDLIHKIEIIFISQGAYSLLLAEATEKNKIIDVKGIKDIEPLEFYPTAIAARILGKGPNYILQLIRYGRVFHRATRRGRFMRHSVRGDSIINILQKRSPNGLQLSKKQKTHMFTQEEIEAGKNLVWGDRLFYAGSYTLAIKEYEKAKDMSTGRIKDEARKQIARCQRQINKGQLKLFSSQSGKWAPKGHRGTAHVRTLAVIAGAAVLFGLLCWLRLAHVAPAAMAAGVPFFCCAMGKMALNWDSKESSRKSLVVEFGQSAPEVVKFITGLEDIDAIEGFMILKVKEKDDNRGFRIFTKTCIFILSGRKEEITFYSKQCVPEDVESLKQIKQISLFQQEAAKLRVAPDCILVESGKKHILVSKKAAGTPLHEFGDRNINLEMMRSICISLGVLHRVCLHQDVSDRFDPIFVSTTNLGYAVQFIDFDLSKQDPSEEERLAEWANLAFHLHLVSKFYHPDYRGEEHFSNMTLDAYKAGYNVDIPDSRAAAHVAPDRISPDVLKNLKRLSEEFCAKIFECGLAIYAEFPKVSLPSGKYLIYAPQDRQPAETALTDNVAGAASSAFANCTACIISWIEGSTRHIYLSHDSDLSFAYIKLQRRIEALKTALDIKDIKVVVHASKIRLSDPDRPDWVPATAQDIAEKLRLNENDVILDIKPVELFMLDEEQRKYLTNVVVNEDGIAIDYYNTPELNRFIFWDDLRVFNKGSRAAVQAEKTISLKKEASDDGSK